MAINICEPKEFAEGGREMLQNNRHSPQSLMKYGHWRAAFSDLIFCVKYIDLGAFGTLTSQDFEERIYDFDSAHDCNFTNGYIF